MNDPTPEQEAHATLAHHEFVEVTNRLIMEGMDSRVILAGISAAAADLIATRFGKEAAAPWFAKQAILVNREFGGSG